jgi:hypothetical protein
MSEKPERHTVHCLRDVGVCRRDGYAILKLQDDGTYDIMVPPPPPTPGPPFGNLKCGKKIRREGEGGGGGSSPNLVV